MGAEDYLSELVYGDLPPRLRHGFTNETWFDDVICSFTSSCNFLHLQERPLHASEHDGSDSISDYSHCLIKPLCKLERRGSRVFTRGEEVM